MCGIIGVCGIPDAARLAYLGLYALQHRGQESAGIVAIDRDGLARSHRGMGLHLSRQIIQEHNGEIEVVPSSGTGATFEIVIPLPE